MLLENRAALQIAGWDYPEFHLLHMAHHPLAYSISGHKTWGLPSGWEEAFSTLLARSDRLIFSSELFFRTVRPQDVARFFPPAETVVVLYLREHLAYMMSWYAQAIQERNLTACFADYLRLFSQSFTSYLAAWEAVYGAENIHIRVFDRSMLKGGDARVDFLQFIEGLDAETVVMPNEVSNISISGNLLFFKAVLNHYMTREEAMTPPITDEFGAFAAVKESFNGKFRVSEEEASLARALFQPDIDMLAARNLVFPEMPRLVEGHLYPDFDTLQEDVSLIKEIAIKTDKKFLKFMARWQNW